MSPIELSWTAKKTNQNFRLVVTLSASSLPATQFLTQSVSFCNHLWIKMKVDNIEYFVSRLKVKVDIYDVFDVWSQDQK